MNHCKELRVEAEQEFAASGKPHSKQKVQLVHNMCARIFFTALIVAAKKVGRNPDVWLTKLRYTPTAKYYAAIKNMSLISACLGGCL